MSDQQKYIVLNQNTRIKLKTRVAFKGDTFFLEEVLKPGLVEALLSVKKIGKVEADIHKH